MADELVYEELLKIVPKDKILLDEPMKKHTSFKIGGEADFFVTVSEVEEVRNILKLARRKNIPVTVIGNGSNMLVRDGGIRGITLKLDFKKMTKEVKGDEIIYTCGSGLPLTLIANRALEDEATGLEFAFGIPGSLGGAIYMNAGAFGGELKDVVFETTYIDKDGDCYTINNEQHEFGYRSTIFQKIDAIILESKLILKKGNKQEIQKKMQENMQSRKDKQPLEFPSAGSVFKRGAGFIAAKLIDECGLKGTKVGDAEISQKHAGFIINRENATAKDVMKLIKHIKEEVKGKTGFEIEEEILIIGDEN